MISPKYSTDKFSAGSIAFRKFILQLWHKILVRYDKDQSLKFLNNGYSRINTEVSINLDDEDMKDHHLIQLYEHLIKQVDLEGKDILEVGSGRGGGAYYISRYYKPESYTGMDISGSNISYCRQNYSDQGLSFVKGERDKQPFEDESFDIILHIDSTWVYSDMEQFLKEVYRVLRPGGYFLLSEMIRKESAEQITYQIIDNEFEIKTVRDITRNVLESYKKESKRKEEIIREKVPPLLRKTFSQFVGFNDAEQYKALLNGTFEYWSYVLVKNEE